MRSRSWLWALLGGALTWGAGCGEKDPQPPPEAPLQRAGPAFLVKDAAGGTPSLFGFEPYNGTSMAIDVAGTLYFQRAPVAFPNNQLWRSDGTQEGTRLVKGPWWNQPSMAPERLTSLNGHLLYAARVSAEDGAPYRLWRHDPATETAEDLTPYQDLPKGAQGDAAVELVEAQGRAFFGVQEGDEGALWVTDGTRNGTRRLRSGLGMEPPLPLASLGARVFFSVRDAETHRALWVSDGTTDGTVKVSDLVPPGGSVGVIRSGAVVGNQWLFWMTAHPEASSELQLWRSDGTPKGTVRVGTDAFFNTAYTSNQTGVVLGDSLVFPRFRYPEQVWELWKSDGWTVELAASLGALEQGPIGLTVLNDHVLFWSAKSRPEYTLWRTDGTQAGTQPLLTTRMVDQSPLLPLPPLVLSRPGGPILFSAWDAEAGLELWRTDGTVQSTVRYADIEPGPESSSPGWMVVSGGHVFFTARTQATGRELWALPIP
ncbi:hypothetical protein D7V80_37485 [Corallococcus sp. CA054B]|uniref:hypothetical protein n=1 Tax=Corallococcus sp. CA054B TaxID=2316734 RepID=UPI000EA374F5|nr:hypothetical protein [Corallococcus sp. CA054B]RKG59164.1 hypothetical protein D7V80_37485 [Corallococcus sp. CA054B]